MEDEGRFSAGLPPGPPILTGSADRGFTVGAASRTGEVEPDARLEPLSAATGDTDGAPVGAAPVALGSAASSVPEAVAVGAGSAPTGGAS